MATDNSAHLASVRALAAENHDVTPSNHTAAVSGGGEAVGAMAFGQNSDVMGKPLFGGAAVLGAPPLTADSAFKIYGEVFKSDILSQNVTKMADSAFKTLAPAPNITAAQGSNGLNMDFGGLKGQIGEGEILTAPKIKGLFGHEKGQAH